MRLLNPCEILTKSLWMGAGQGGSMGEQANSLKRERTRQSWFGGMKTHHGFCPGADKNEGFEITFLRKRMKDLSKMNVVIILGRYPVPT